MSSTRGSTPSADNAVEVLHQPSQAADPAKHTYGHILKSSALIGGSSVLNIGIGIVRTKTIALLLGPAGVGLFGLYGSIASLTQSVAGMGINSSGVRQIAEAVGSGDARRIAQTTVVLRRIAVLLGLLGGALLVILARQISAYTFGTDRRSTAVSLLSVAVFFTLVSDGQGALIQGLRRIADLARIRVLSALFGTLVTIPVVFVLREKGVVPSLLGVAVTGCITSWWYSRTVVVQTVPMTAAELGRETAALLKLGLAFMASGLMTMGIALVVRIAVLHRVGVEGAGLYQSAWALGGLYVGIILQAMGADFYPRLTACASDDTACNRMVNEQARVGLLLAGPGVIATLTFAPVVIEVLYSARFDAAVALLRWICLGATLQVVSWPMGFIILAKGKRAIFFWSEFAWTVVSLALAWICVATFGLNGAGIAFFASYIFHGLMIYPLVRGLSDFRWSPENRRTGMLFLCLIAVAYGCITIAPKAPGTCFGALITLVTTGYSMKALTTLVPVDQLPRSLRALIRQVRALGLATS